MIGTRIRECLIEEHSNKNRLSVATGIPYETICYIIRADVRRLEYPVVKKLADALDVRWEWLYSGEGERRVWAQNRRDV